MGKFFGRAAVLAALALASGLATSVSGQEIPNKPYSEWSPDEVQQAAQSLQSICQPQCLPLADGGQRGAFEAAACNYACYVNHLPADYPNVSQLESLAWQSYDQAKSMGSLSSEPSFPRP